MTRGWALILVVAVSGTAFAEEKTIDLKIGDVTVAKTVITPYDDSTKESREATYKVFTHIMDFAGEQPITKGVGGRYTHHRGLFIGWRETTVGDKKFDTWHMTDCYQEFEESIPVYLPGQSGEGADERIVGGQGFRIAWRGEGGTRILDEERGIVVQIAEDGSRVFDFTSKLTAGDQPITFRGDSHHAGMQIRLSNEVSEHEDTTEYTIAPGGEFLANDEASGTWWTVCVADIGGKRYWVMHMTLPDVPGGPPLYSLRKYARFGALFQPDLAANESLTARFRIVVSETEITAERAAELYAEYAR